jgi:hypothetical protein
LDDFSQPKLVYKEISVKMEAAIVPAGWFVNNKLYMIVGAEDELRYLCAFLNSKIFSKIILQSANFGGGKGVDFLEKIRLPKPCDYNIIMHLSELEIDKYFCSEYKLSQEETTYILNSKITDS